MMSYPNEEMTIKMQIEDLELDFENMSVFEGAECAHYYEGQNTYFCQLPDTYLQIFRELRKMKQKEQADGQHFCMKCQFM